jgi:hypothetical protein
MSDTNISKATSSNIANVIEDFSVGAKSTDAATGQEETEYMNKNAAKQLGYYLTIPELQKAIQAIATYTVGKGWTTDDYTDIILGHITGWGEDTFNSIAWNLFIQKKIYGDAFAEIIRSEKTGELINLKPLDPSVIKTIVDKYGIVKRYEQMSKNPDAKPIQTFKPNEILHLCNDRIADQIHGTSVLESCTWTIDAWNEAMADQRLLAHRNVKPIFFFKLDTDDQTKINEFVAKMDLCIAKGNNIYVPKGNVEFEIMSIPENATLNNKPWIQYLENKFYQAVGVPKIIVGGSQELTEATAKIAYLTFQQVYEREQAEFEADIWNQLGIEITMNKPVSLQNDLMSDNSKDANSMAITKPGEMAITPQQE